MGPNGDGGDQRCNGSESVECRTNGDYERISHYLPGIGNGSEDSLRLPYVLILRHREQDFSQQ